MKCVACYRPGGAEQLYVGEAEKPSPGALDLLVKVEFAGLNRADLLQREGKYPPPPGASTVPGLEFSGTVVAIGSGVTKWKPGDKVFGLVPGGAHAEYALIHEEMALALPVNLTFEQASAIPEVFLTAFQSLVWLAKVKTGEKVLVHAGASGVGTAAIQLIRQLGAVPFITASAGKHLICLSLGAEAAVDYKSEGFWDKLKELTGGVDVIVDPVGGSYFDKNLQLMNLDARLVMLAVMGGTRASEVSIGQIVFKRLQILGSTLRSRSLSYQQELTRDFWSRFGESFRNDMLKPVIDRVFGLDDIRQAHEYLESNSSIGKVLLKVG